MKKSIDSSKEKLEYSDFDDNNDFNFQKQFLLHFPPININDYENFQLIGKGAYGSVYKIQNKKAGFLYAAKVLRKTTQLPYKHFINELTILSQISHPSIIKFIGYSPISFNGESDLTLITDYYPNDSLQRILDIKHGTEMIWTDTMKLICIYGIASAMKYLHSLNILHRDLKTDNVLLDESFFPILIDFGISKQIKGDSIEEDSNYGTPMYMSPEIFRDCIYSKASDVYAFAIVVYQIFVNKNPFKGIKTTFELMFKVAERNFRPPIYKSTPKQYKDLIESCWDEDPSKRPTFEQIVNLLETKEFITSEIDEKQFRSYIKMISEGNVDEVFSENQKESINLAYKSVLEEEERFKEEKILQIEKEIRSLKIDEIDLDEYQKVKNIGNGNFGGVYLLMNKKTKVLYAAKELNMNKNSEDDFLNELKILSHVNHPLITKLVGYSLTGFLKERNMIIITEFISNGTLENILQKKRYNVQNDVWNEIMELINIYGIVSALQYLHSLNILHLDIKPLNVLIDDYLFPVLCDFGLALQLKNNQTINKNTAGTSPFIAPEIYTNGKYSPKSDVYAFAILLNEIKSNQYPFEGYHTHQILNEVVSKQSRPNIKESVPEIYKDLIKTSWSQNPDERPFFNQISNQLKSDKRFITEKVDEKLYRLFIEIIDEKLKGIDAENKLNKSFNKYDIESIYEEAMKKEMDETVIDSTDIIYTIDSFDEKVEISAKDTEKMKQIHNELDSTVYEYNDAKTRKSFSIKMCDFPIHYLLNKEERIKSNIEMRELCQIKHPAIQQFYNVSFNKIQRNQKTIIVNEFVPYHTLFNILSKNQQQSKKGEWNSTKKWINIYGIASALQYLNIHNIRHPIPNPKNILVDLNYYPKMIDIGEINRQISLYTTNRIIW